MICRRQLQHSIASEELAEVLRHQSELKNRNLQNIPPLRPCPIQVSTRVGEAPLVVFGVIVASNPNPAFVLILAALVPR
eukprot:scaffold74700_cov60-Phaeocystis_antarctica.AAC.9